MERYNKYLVLKNEDIAKHLSDEKQLKLDALVTNIRVGRLQDGKRDQEYVVVAADWPIYETVWGLIEAFVDNKPNEIDQLRARVAELEAEVSRLKTVPMKYRRMQFNAELQEQVAKLEAQLADHKKLLLLAKRAMEAFTDPEGNMPAKTGEFNDLKDALAGIDNSKLVEGLILCDAEPIGEVEAIDVDDDAQPSAWVCINTDIELGTPLYSPRRTEK